MPGDVRPDPRVAFGRRGEELAEQYLCRRGYVILARRFRTRQGEIDLIARSGETIVFVEVRRRRTGRLGDPLESIGPRKQARLVRTARVFLHARGLHEQPCRFDVVALREADGAGPVIDHREDAFRADGRFS